MLSFSKNAISENDFQFSKTEKTAASNITSFGITDTLKRNVDFNKAFIVVCHSKNSTENPIKENYSNAFKNTNNNQISFTSKIQIEQEIEDNANSIQTHTLANNVKINTINSPEEKSTCVLIFIPAI